MHQGETLGDAPQMTRRAAHMVQKSRGSGELLLIWGERINSEAGESTLENSLCGASTSIKASAE